MLKYDSIVDSKNTIENSTRRKRLKVVSACNECRRKKTKCNGEKPCTGCIKNNIECKYSVSMKNKSSPSTSSYHHRPIIPHKTTITNNFYPPPLPPPPAATVAPVSVQQQQDLYKMNCTLSNTIQSIEGRLGAIENILQTLLQQYQPKEQSPFVQPNHSFQQNSSDKYDKLPLTSCSSLTIKNLLNNDTSSSSPNNPHYCK